MFYEPFEASPFTLSEVSILVNVHALSQDLDHLYAEGGKPRVQSSRLFSNARMVVKVVRYDRTGALTVNRVHVVRSREWMRVFDLWMWVTAYAI